MIRITNIDIFENRFRPEKTGWLLAVTPETITATLEVSVGWFAVANNNAKIYFNPGGYANSQEIIKCPAPVFAEFKLGDTIDIINTGGINDRASVVITEKISDNVIRIGGDTFTADISLTAEVIGKTPITGFKFLYGLIENSEAVNYLSKIDGSTQQFTAENVDATDTVTIVPLLPDGATTWQNGSATIIGAGVDTYYQNFVITHEFLVLPPYLATQFTDLQNGIKPSYFADVKCLKYATKFIGLYFANDPNNIQTGEASNVLGNTGWLDENFNNVPTKYTVDSVTHTDIYSTVLSGVELTTNENTFEIVIKNTTDTPFSNNNTKVELGFSLCPEATEYKDLTKNVVENFAMDKALLTLGSAAIDGDLFGTDEQIFKEVVATFTSTSEIKITGKFSLQQTLIDRVLTFLNHRYFIYVITQDHTLATANADKVSLLVEANEFFQQLSVPTLIQFNNNLYPHNNENLEPSIQTEYFPGDEIVFGSQIALNLTGLDGDLINFKTLKTEIYVSDGTNEFVLETFTYNFINDIKVNGVTFVNFTQNRNFKLPLNDDRRLISIQRRLDLDAGDVYYYEILYPFAFRWEYWVANAVVDNAFFDILEPQNGKNHFWDRFNDAGWTVNIRHTMLVDNNGNDESFVTSEPLPSVDYDSNADWINETIKTYNLAAVELTSGGNKYVQAFADTKVEAFFEKSTPFNSGDIVVVIWAEAFEAGGIAGRTRISSMYDVGSESWFKGVASLPLRVKLTFGGGDTTVLAEALLDYTKIPAGVDKIEIYSRIFEGLEDESVLLQEDGFYLLQEDLGKINLP
jgi:hypothetical protein